MKISDSSSYGVLKQQDIKSQNLDIKDGKNVKRTQWLNLKKRGITVSYGKPGNKLPLL